MVKKRAGVDAGGAATLIIIIALVLLLYILFIPPDLREELLENGTSSSEGSESVEDENLLLDENVGTLKYADEDNKEYKIGNIYLYETTNAEIIDSINPFIIRNGWFEKKFKTINFKIEDVENTDNVILSLSTTEADGILYIYLNGEIIYEGEFTSSSPAPIPLKQSLLKEDNVLIFEVVGVGMAFWDVNEYQFKTAEIIGDVTDLSGQEGQNTLNIPEEDYINIDTASFSFVPYCGNLKTVGQLTIEINRQNVFSAIPVCDDSYHQSFDLNILKKGSNTVKFYTNKGSYNIEQIEIDLEMADAPSALYYFELNETQIIELQSEDKEAWVFIEFVDNNEDKKADININGHLRNIDQDEAEWDKDITEWVEEGNNYIEILPKNTLHIVNLQIFLEEV